MIKFLFKKFNALSFRNQVIVTILIIISIVFFIYKKNEYLVNPNHKLYKQFEWTTWEDSAGGRMAHDPKWLAMVPDKYIPKEVPFKFSFFEKLQPANERRWKYFDHLCKTEMVGYRVEDYPEHMKNSKYHLESNTFIYINRGELPVKGMKELYDIAESEESTKKEREDAKQKIKNIWTITQQNPYVYSSVLGAIPKLKEGKLYDLFLRKVEGDFYEKHKEILPPKSTFREYLDNEGYIWRVSYDSIMKQYLPIEKDKKIKSQYYIIWKKEQNEEMKKLGIWKESGITVDIKNQRVMSYGQGFTMPSYLSSLRNSSFQLPIDWNSMVFCADKYLNNQKYTIKEFN